MTRKLLLCLIVLLFPAVVFAAFQWNGSSITVWNGASITAWNGVTVGSASALTDSCTGGLVFSWHMENTDVTLGGVAGGVNNGCSAGDTTATAINGIGGLTSLSATQYEDGAKSAHFGRTDYYKFDISSEDIFSHSAGTIDVWVYTPATFNGFMVVSGGVDANNYINLVNTGGGANSFRLFHSAGGTVQFAYSALNPSASTWYHIIAKWDYTAHATHYIQICADTTTGTTNCGYGTTALGTWAGTLPFVAVGNHDLSSGGYTFDAIYVDVLKIYSSWQ